MRLCIKIVILLFISILVFSNIDVALSKSSIEQERQRMLQQDRQREMDERAQEARQRSSDLQKIKNAGFVAISDKFLNYNEAVEYCRKRGGRLPRINNSNFWNGDNPPERGVVVDGFGFGHRPWKDIGLPKGTRGYYIGGEPVSFWTDTKKKYSNGKILPWFVFFEGLHGGRVEFFIEETQGASRAACVPF